MRESARRLKNLEKKMQGGTVENLGRLAELIAQGAYYDELSEEEKDAYCAYQGHNREAMETVEKMVTGTLHFQVERKPRPLTDAEYKERVEEVKAYMKKATEEYNSEEAKRKREAEYQELQRLGELRRNDFYCGRDMDKEHPLPWQEKKAEA